MALRNLRTQMQYLSANLMYPRDTESFYRSGNGDCIAAENGSCRDAGGGLQEHLRQQLLMRPQPWICAFSPSAPSFHGRTISLRIGDQLCQGRRRRRPTGLQRAGGQGWGVGDTTGGSPLISLPTLAAGTLEKRPRSGLWNLEAYKPCLVDPPPLSLR
ncbi:hypothetical protein NDU88_005824 [Pleurodeles waltl]|uniref:Uncharacterized protein n=1 Tax=Pleurodeles waltl TaxID=8319 RepID=A0AAV7WC54_PLEWA|nr:hypothetical protein NDU88_005824 [Pleurodeles waltl]